MRLQRRQDAVEFVKRMEKEKVGVEVTLGPEEEQVVQDQSEGDGEEAS